ncbi:MAG: hypothetical protein AB7E61_06265 [Acholeplasmataceae bacterium]
MNKVNEEFKRIYTIAKEYLNELNIKGLAYSFNRKPYSMKELQEDANKLFEETKDSMLEQSDAYDEAIKQFEKLTDNFNNGKKWHDFEDGYAYDNVLEVLKQAKQDSERLEKVEKLLEKTNNEITMFNAKIAMYLGNNIMIEQEEIDIQYIWDLVEELLNKTIEGKKPINKLEKEK